MPEDKQLAVKSLLLPLATITMLIANANVAEIVSSFTIEKTNSGEQWLLGHTHWRGSRIPVISLDILAGEEIDIDTAKVSYVVFYTIDESNKYQYYAVLMHGIPKFEFASKDNIEELEDAPKNEYFVKNLLIAGRPVSVPNLNKIESILS
jgi:chemosensory pili system protein ChpC